MVKIRETNFYNYVCVICYTALFSVANAALAIDQDIADNPLEIAPTAPPNVLLLLDNSNPMDFEVLTQDAVNMGLFNNTNPDGTGGGFAAITQRTPEVGAADDNCILIASAFGGYGYAVAFPSNVFIALPAESANCYVADDDAWRFRNFQFNPFYFNPNKNYQPWAGEFDFDSDGDTEPFPPADITAAVDDPINPQFTINLLTQKSGLDLAGNRITDNIGFKYYLWTDSNGDGNFDDGEQTEFLIKDQSPAVQQNFANWFVYNRSREYEAKAILSELITNTAGSRVGLAAFNSVATPGAPVADMNQLPSQGNKQALLSAVYNSQLASGSEVRASLEKAGLYFECEANDIFGSSSTSNPGDAACPVLGIPAGTCQRNEVIMITGSFQDTFTSISGITDDDSDDNTLFDGGAFADGNANTLADIAMNFNERDLHPEITIINNVPVTLNDILSFPSTPALRLDDNLGQNMRTNIISLGLQGTGITEPTDPTASFTWTNHNIVSPNGAEFVDGMLHAAYNGRGRFLQAFGSSDLRQQLQSVFRSSSTATIPNATLAFSTQAITEDTVVFRTFSNIAANSGDLVSQNVLLDGSFEEDGSNDPIFNWRAAPPLETRAPSSRVMITNDPTNTAGGREFNLSANGLLASQTTRLQVPAPANVSPVSDIVPIRVDFLRGSRDDEGNDFNVGDMRTRVDLGSEVGLGGKISDLVNSGIVFVGAPFFTQRFGGAWPDGADSYDFFRDADSNQNRERLVYVGASMLHAFRAADGVEKFAYVPDILLDELGEFTSPDYAHRFFVDARPRVNDAFIDPAGGTSRSWNTILIGGLGAGGKGYYALNITDPTQFDAEASAVDQVLWEFTETDDDLLDGSLDGVSDLGFTYSEPVIGMSNVSSSGDQKWVAIFGNGYNSTSSSGDAYIYIVFIEQGVDGWDSSDVIKINTQQGIAENVNGIRNGISDIRGVDEDGNGTLDRLYAGDLHGNVYVVNISSDDEDDWDNASNIEIIFTAKYGTATRDEIQPITTRPEVILHPSAQGYIVIVATGSYFTNQDATSTEIQSIYGLWDNSFTFSDVGIGGSFPIEFKNPSTSDQLIEQTLSSSIDVLGIVRTSTNNVVDWDDTGSEQVRGWFVDFDTPPPGGDPGDSPEFPGERAVRGIVLQENILFFNTVIPQNGQFCTSPDGGFVSALNPETGGSGISPIFDINNDAVINASDFKGGTISQINIITGVKSDTGLGDTIVLDNYVGGGTLDGGSKLIRIAEQDTSSASIEPLLGRHSWKQIEY